MRGASLRSMPVFASSGERGRASAFSASEPPLSPAIRSRRAAQWLNQFCTSIQRQLGASAPMQTPSPGAICVPAGSVISSGCPSASPASRRSSPPDAGKMFARATVCAVEKPSICAPSASTVVTRGAMAISRRVRSKIRICNSSFSCRWDVWPHGRHSFAFSPPARANFLPSEICAELPRGHVRRLRRQIAQGLQSRPFRAHPCREATRRNCQASLG